MNAGIVVTDDLALDRDCVGHVDDVVEDAAKGVGNGGFAVAGRPIEKHGAAGVECGTALLDACCRRR
jgi:hypothetical protein